MSETNLKLRSNNFKSVKVTAPTGGLTAGQFYVSAGLIGIIVDTVAAGAETVMIYSCDKIVVPKGIATADVFAVGTKVYYDASDGNINVSSTGNTLVGRATEAALAADATAEIDLHGDIIA